MVKSEGKKKRTQKNARYQANLDMENRQSGFVKQDWYPREIEKPNHCHFKII